METTTLEDVSLAEVDAIMERRKGEKGALIPILQETQEAYGYLPKVVLARIAEQLGVPFSQVFGVATFYSQFYLTRRGRNVIKICDGTACHVRGAPRNMTTIEKELGIQPGETTDDYQFTYEVVYCLGACALGPVTVVNGNVKGRCSSEKIHQLVDETRRK